jgi:ABC-type branched-subunit amino acid transport system ATPase component/branched-subunit amino acid ABC-type transport system permease component
MTQVPAELLLGLGNGAVFGALALALVLTYRSSGVLNLATSAIALYAAYTFAFLRQGQLFIPIPGPRATVSIGSPLGTGPALAISLAAATAVGLLSYLLIFRPLRHSPPAVGFVASVGLLAIIQGVIAARVGTGVVSVGPIFPVKTLTLSGMPVTSDRLYLGATITVIAVALAVAMRFTRFGLATRAAAETEKGAVVTGISPDRIAVANWAISSLIAGLAGILIAPIVPLQPVAYSLFIVPALAAALLGQFSAIAPAVIGGLAIGMVQSWISFLQAEHPALPQTGLQETVPLVLIFVLLAVRGRSLPGRGALITHTLGRAPRPRTIGVPAVAGVVIGVAAIFATQGQYRAALVTSLITGMICLSLVVVSGYTGQISLAQLTLAGTSGFLLSTATTSWGLPFPVAPLVAALITTGIGLILGAVVLRARAMALAVVTLAFAVAVEAFWFDNSSLNGGLNGAPVRPPTLFGLNLGPGAGTVRPAFAIMCLAVLTVVAVSVALLRRSRLGGAMLAVRANERSAAAAGINVRLVRLAAFGIGAFIAGLGGDLITYQQTIVPAASFTALGGIGLFATAYLAGVTSVSGGLLGGILTSGGLVFVFLTNVVSLGSWYDVVTGILLILTVIFYPEGLARGFHQIAERWPWRRGPVPAQATAQAAAIMPVPVRGAAGGGLADRAALLSVRSASVHYGGVAAVSAVSLDVPAGAIVGLIGPNGAGKTSLMDAISGFAVMSGDVIFAGRPVGHLQPHQRVLRGLGRTFQGIELYNDLSVEENVSVGDQSRRRGGRDLSGLFALLGLGELRARPVAELSHGQRQLVSIARALAGGPSLVLLDEPAAGLDSRESQWLAGRLRDIRASGVSMLLVDHDMNLMLGLCDVLYVIDFGSLIASGTPADVRGNEKVIRAYLGSTHATTAQGSPPAASERARMPGRGAGPAPLEAP